MSFQEKLKKLCNENGMTPNAVAVKVGVSEQSASNWMHGSVPRRGTLQKIADLFSVPVSYFFEEDAAPATPVSQSLGAMVMMPIIGSVRAGLGEVAEEVYTGQYTSVGIDVLHNDPTQYRVLKTDGMSMYPFIQEGDLLIIRLQPELQNGEYGVFILADGEATVKKFHITENGMELLPVNPMYPPIPFGSDGDRIWGKVVMVQRSL